MRYMCSWSQDRRAITVLYTSGMHLVQFMNWSHFKGTHWLPFIFQMRIAGLCLGFCSRISFPDVLFCWGKVNIFPFSSLLIKIQSPNLSRYFTEIVNVMFFSVEGFGWPKRLLNKTCLAWQVFFKSMVEDSPWNISVSSVKNWGKKMLYCHIF